MMKKEYEQILAGSCLLLALCFGLVLLLQQSVGLPALRAVFPFLLIAFIVSALVCLRVRLARLAEEEKRAEALAREERPDSALFEPAEEELEPFTMARSREQFDRFVVPFTAPLLALLELFFAWRFYRGLGALTEQPGRLLPASAFLTGQAFLLFLASRFILGLSRTTRNRILKGPGIYIGLASFVSLLAVATCLATEFGFVYANIAAGWTAIVFLAFLGIENILNTLGAIYRPRRGKNELNTSYESRIGALLTDPATWVRNIAQAMDYQFGFQISETWFYRFLANALLPLIIFQLLVLYLLSCFVFLGPSEEAIVERFGRALDPVSPRARLESGFHLKWPWPFESIRRFSTHRIRTLHVGFANAPEKLPQSILWTVPHHLEKEIFLVASHEGQVETSRKHTTVPVNFLSVHMPIEYRITNIYHYAYNYTDPEQLLEQIAYRNLSRTAVSHGLFDLVGHGRLNAARLLKENIRGDACRLNLGIAIEFVGLQGVHPPVPIAPAFESVIGAVEEKESIILTAQAYTNCVLPMAAAEADAKLQAAQAYTARRIEMASSEAYRFEQRLRGYEKSPLVFKTDIYLRSLKNALSGARKYIIGAKSSSQVIQFDFEDKINPDLFDFGPAWEGSGL